MRKLALSVGAGALLAGLAVVSAEETPKPAEPAKPTADATAPPVVAKAEKPHYVVTVKAPKGCPATGAAAEVTLAPAAHYKFNKAYPTKVKLATPPGVQPKQAVLKKKDASSMTDAGAVFPVSYTCTAPAAGEVKAETKFSVCDAKTCKLITETVAWSVAP